MICTTYYLDENLKPSQSFEEVFNQTNDTQAALEAYLAAMGTVLNTRFSRASNIEPFDAKLIEKEQAEKEALSKERVEKEKKLGIKTSIRVTNIKSNVAGKPDEDRIRKSVMRSLIKEEVLKDLKKGSLKDKQAEWLFDSLAVVLNSFDFNELNNFPGSKLDKLIEHFSNVKSSRNLARLLNGLEDALNPEAKEVLYFKSDASINDRDNWEKSIKDLKEFFDLYQPDPASKEVRDKVAANTDEFAQETAETRAGTAIHKHAENFTKQYYRYFVENKDNIQNTSFSTFLNTLSKDTKKDYEQFQPIYDFLLNSFSNGYIPMQELPLFSEDELNLGKDEDGKDLIYTNGITGTADLILYNPETNSFTVNDYKTKQESFDFNLFENVKFGDFKNPILNQTGALRTGLNEVMVQTNIYGLLFNKLLESKGIYNATFEGSKVIIIKEVKKGKPEKEIKIIESDEGKLIRTAIAEILNLKSTESATSNVDTTKSLNTPHLIMKKIIGEEIKIAEELSLDERITREFINYPNRKNSKGRRFFYESDGRTEKEYKDQTDTPAGIEARRAEFKKYWESQPSETAKAVNKALEGFTKGRVSTKANLFLERQLNALFGLKNSGTHKIFPANTLPGYSHLASNILCLKNKRNNSFTLVKVSPAGSESRNRNLALNGKETNLLNKLLSENEIARKYKVSADWSYDKFDAESLELGILASQLLADPQVMAKEKFTTVEEIRVGIIGGKSDTGKFPAPAVYSGADLDTYIHGVVFKVLKEQPDIYNNLGENLKNRIDEVVSNPRKHRLEYGAEAKLNELIKVALETTNFAFYGMSTEDIKYFKSLKDSAETSDLLNYLDNMNALETQQLIKNLMSLSERVGQRLAIRQDEATVEEKRFYKVLQEAYIGLIATGINLHSYTTRASVDNKWRTPSHIGNELIQVIDKVKKKNDLEISRKHNEFKNKSAKVIEALKKEKLGSGWQAATTADLHAIFKNLYKVDPDKKLQKGDDGKDLFILKDANDPNDAKTLSKAEIDYINFFNDSIKNYYKKLLTPGQYKKFESSWRLGQVPLLKSSLENKISRAENIKEKLAIALKGSKRSTWKEGVSAVTNYFKLDTANYETEVTGEEIQASKTRRDKLGLNMIGEVDNLEVDMLETNLDTIINHVVSDALQAEYHKETITVWNGLKYINTLNDSEFFRNTSKETGELLDSYLHSLILGEQKDEGKGAAGLDRLQQGITNLQLGLNPRHFLLEMATGAIASTSSIFTQNLNRIGGKGNQMFSTASWLWAGAQLFKDVISRQGNNYTKSEHIAKTFALIKSDPSRLTGSEHLRTKRNFLFKTSNLHKLNNIFADEATIQMFIAHLKHLGVMDAYVEKDGTYVYQAHLDHRFNKIFDEKKELKTSDKLDDAGKKQLSLYMSIYRDLIKDGYEINNINELPMPMASNDVERTKTFISGIYGSLDQRSKIMAQEMIMARLMFKFKNWMVIKKDTWWSRGGYKESFGQRVTFLNENGEYETRFEAQWHEGIIQTLGHMTTGFITNPADLLKGLAFQKNETWDNMTTLQKTNIRKAISDLITIALFNAMLAALRNNEYFKSKKGKVAHTLLMNAVSDLNILQMLSNLFTQGPFVVFTYMKRVVEATFNLIAMEPETDDLKVFGGLVSSALLFLDEEVEKSRETTENENAK